MSSPCASTGRLLLRDPPVRGCAHWFISSPELADCLASTQPCSATRAQVTSVLTPLPGVKCFHGCTHWAQTADMERCRHRCPVPDLGLSYDITLSKCLTVVPQCNPRTGYLCASPRTASLPSSGCVYCQVMVTSSPALRLETNDSTMPTLTMPNSTGLGTLIDMVA